LRPQLFDRFGLYTQIATITDVDQRIAIVERRERFDDSPAAFLDEWNDAQDELRRRITRAKKLLARVELDRELLMMIAELCVALKVDGHRGELTIARAARALAAFEGRAKASVEDVERVAVMSVRHRLRRDPLETVDSSERIEQALGAMIPKPKSARLAVIK
jgi:magnesium chelatase subunit I